jgi:hypothetical protein
MLRMILLGKATFRGNNHNEKNEPDLFVIGPVDGGM